jgi:hypothetical protein
MSAEYFRFEARMAKKGSVVPIFRSATPFSSLDEAVAEAIKWVLDNREMVDGEAASVTIQKHCMVRDAGCNKLTAFWGTQSRLRLDKILEAYGQEEKEA